jgi:hypothetical protein
MEGVEIRLLLAGAKPNSEAIRIMISAGGSRLTGMVIERASDKEQAPRSLGQPTWVFRRRAKESPASSAGSFGMRRFLEIP